MKVGSRQQRVKNINDLPKNAEIYIFELEKFIETKISSVSTSPERNINLIEDPLKFNSLAINFLILLS